MPSFRTVSILIIFLWICCTPYIWAAEPVQVTVEGVEGDALENVLAALAIPSGFVRDGKVDAAWLRLFEHEAPEKARTALQPFGYYNARITTSLETVGEGNSRLRVKVEPGVPVLVTDVHVAVRGAGSKDKSLQDLAKDFPLGKGDVLLQNAYETAKATLLTRTLELGYQDAEFSTHEIIISRDKTAARIELVLETGPKYLFDGTNIVGAQDYPDRFLRRYLAYKPGETFSPAKLNETQLNFINADRFREVIVAPEKEKAHDLQVPVLVQLKQSPNRRLRVGGGYGTDTGARITGRYRDVNIFHLGHELQTDLYVAQFLQGLGFGYVIPGAKDLNSSTGLQLNLQREDVTTYTDQLISVEVNRNRSFGLGRLGTVYLRLLQENFTVGTENSSSRIILPGIRFSERRYDDLVRPTKGYRYTLEVRGTHQFLGSDTGFIQFLADGTPSSPCRGVFPSSRVGKWG